MKQFKDIKDYMCGVSLSNELAKFTNEICIKYFKVNKSNTFFNLVLFSYNNQTQFKKWILDLINKKILLPKKPRLYSFTLNLLLQDFLYDTAEEFFNNNSSLTIYYMVKFSFDNKNQLEEWIEI